MLKKMVLFVLLAMTAATVGAIEIPQPECWPCDDSGK